MCTIFAIISAKNVRKIGKNLRALASLFSLKTGTFRALALCLSVGCKGRWQQGHRHDKQDILKHVRNCIQNGELLVDFITDFIDGVDDTHHEFAISDEPKKDAFASLQG